MTTDSAYEVMDSIPEMERSDSAHGGSKPKSQSSTYEPLLDHNTGFRNLDLEVVLEPAYQAGSVLYEHANFLEAADFAAEFVERRNPEALEIRRAEGNASETVWTYSESRARAAEAAQERLVDTFGFDPNRWGRPVRPMAN